MNRALITFGIKAVLIGIVVMLAFSGCAPNESTVHAKKAVELLRRLEAEADTGLPKVDGMRTLAAAKHEHRQIKDGEVPKLVPGALAISIMRHELALDEGNRWTRKIKENPYGNAKEMFAEHRAELDSHWAEAIKYREEAAEQLGMK